MLRFFLLAALALPLSASTAPTQQTVLQASPVLKATAFSTIKLPPLPPPEVFLPPVEKKPAPAPAHLAHPVKQTGEASWYGPGFQGSPTSTGEPFNTYAMTAAHRTLPFGTMVTVTCPSTGRSVVVRINDNGPFVKGRIIDLSFKAAHQLGLNPNWELRTGTCPNAQLSC